MVESSRPQPKSLDVKWLECGAFNIPENHVCGRCGASLPLVYDEEGKVFSWGGDVRSRQLLSQGAHRRLSPSSVRSLMRLGVILFALLVALWILSHKR